MALKVSYCSVDQDFVSAHMNSKREVVKIVLSSYDNIFRPIESSVETIMNFDLINIRRVSRGKSLGLTRI